MSFSIGQKGLIMVLVPLALNLFVLAGLGYLLHQEGLQKQQVEKENEISQRGDNVRRLLLGAGQEAFEYTLRPNSARFARYGELKQEINDNYKRLELLVSNDRAQSTLLAHINLIELRTLKIYDAAVSAAHEGRDGFTIFKELQLAYELQALSQRFVAEIEKFMSIENGRKSLGTHADWLVPLKAFLLASVLANIGLSVFLTFYFGRNFAYRLTTMIDNTVRLASHQPLNEKVDGNDEIAMLDGVYHEMADVLKESRKKERIFIDNAVDIICTIDEKRKFTDVSPSSEQVWGYSPADLIGRSIAAVTAADDLATTFADVSEPGAETVEKLFENRIKHKDGRLVDMLWSTYWSTRKRTYFCVAHDITESKAAENLLKESEARILTVIENLPVGLLIQDGQGNAELINKKAEEMLLVGRSDLLNRNISSSFVPRKKDSAGINILPVKSTERVEELSCIRGDGSKLPIELHRNDLFYQRQRKSLSIIVDVSERYQLENARKELVHMVSHDLRTPLNSVEAVMELLMRGVLGQLTLAETDMVLESKQELRRLLALINGLLDLEKIQAGALELEREVNSSLSIAGRALDAIMDLAKKSQVVVTSQARDSELLCDAERLIEVIVLFVMDALRQKTPPAAISIFADQADDGEATQFKVVARHHPQRRTGGDTAAQVDRRDIYWQSGRSGSGLWLVICKGIVSAHKGKLEIGDNDKGESVYSFKIPLPGSAFAQGGD